jgi:hypothetical protein
VLWLVDVIYDVNILVMDVLGYLITKAENEGLLQPIATRALQHIFSIYDNVVIFIQPTVRDISIVLDIFIFLGRLLGLNQHLEKQYIPN